MLGFRESAQVVVYLQHIDLAMLETGLYGRDRSTAFA
jgi:hypothetical protein